MPPEINNQSSINRVVFSAAFTIVPGHAANFVKISVQTYPNILFLLWISETIGGGANWNDTINTALDTLPGIALAGQLDSQAISGFNVTIGRGKVVGVEFPLGVFNPLATSGKASNVMGVSDTNGFLDIECKSTTKATFFLNAGLMGALPIQSRQIIAGDYA